MDWMVSCHSVLNGTDDMEEKKSNENGSVNAHSRGQAPGKQMDQGFKAFEDLISEEENVEYEEDISLQPFKRENRLFERGPVVSKRLDIRPSGRNEGRGILIPLQIKLPNGVSEEYLLSVSISLKKASQSEVSFSGEGAYDLGPDSEDHPEIDILDGRTTLIYGEEEEDEETPQDPGEIQAASWWDRLLSLWRRKS